jgi:bisphosphoglycerate-independent phosphoglycerate mutase (AlkP superfamily)
LIAADWVPGVILSNRKVIATRASLLDIAPTVLAEFGIAKPDSMKGKNLLAKQ